MGKGNYEFLEQKFGITQLDVQNRESAGIFSCGKIYIGKEHITAIEQCRKDNPELKNKMTFLHFLNSNNKLIGFIDCLALFGKTPISEVVRVITEQLKVAEIYEYEYPNRLKQIYKLCD